MVYFILEVYIKNKTIIIFGDINIKRDIMTMVFLGGMILGIFIGMVISISIKKANRDETSDRNIK